MPRCKRTRLLRQREFGLAASFEALVRREPEARQQVLLDWVRHRPRPRRVFWVLDPSTGDWHQL
jgi:hypothetical protein